MSENCAETHQSYRFGTRLEGAPATSHGYLYGFRDALPPKTWPQSRQLLYTLQRREDKTEIPDRYSGAKMEIAAWEEKR